MKSSSLSHPRDSNVISNSSIGRGGWEGRQIIHLEDG